jgi:hypothetical protein
MVMRKNFKEYRISTNNCDGFMTVDFLFGIVITFTVMLALFRVCYSLLMVEVAQYIAYSTSRAHAVADLSVEDQRKAGMDKYKELKNNPAWAHLFKDAFEINKESDLGILRSGEAAGGTFDDYLYSNTFDGNDLSGIPFIGVVLNIKLTWLNMNIPFLGRTSDADDEFKTKITSFLLREPSYKECHQFMEDRYEAILSLDSSRFGPAQAVKQAYVPLEDNGC